MGISESLGESERPAVGVVPFEARETRLAPAEASSSLWRAAFLPPLNLRLRCAFILVRKDSNYPLSLSLQPWSQ